LGNTITLLQRHHKSFIKNIYRLIEFNFINKEYLKLIKYFILSNEEGSDKLAELTKAKLFLDKHYPVGIDFNFWKSDATSEESRKILKIAGDKFVILSSSRLNGLKQIDKLIICLSKLRHRNYLCYISGHGTREYEAYLSKLITQHGLGENIKLIGYVETNELKNYYQSCNIFISVSSCEGGPTSPLYAMLLKKPVLVTKTGKTFEFMKRVSRGYTIPVDNITEWTEIIDKLIDKDELETIPLKEAIDFVDWDNIANFYNNTFKEILK